MFPSLRKQNRRLLRPPNRYIYSFSASLNVCRVKVPASSPRNHPTILDLSIDGINGPRLAAGASTSGKSESFKMDDLNDSQGSSHPDSPDSDHQKRMANLGTTIEELKILVPNLLHKSLPKELLLPDIMLRMNPSHLDLLKLILPNIKGHVSYYAACKALQLFFTSVVLNPHAQFHIQLVRTSNFPEPNTVFAHSTKIYMRWNTCEEGCTHLHNENVPDSVSTSRAKLGSHQWSGFDPDKVIDKDNSSWSVTGSLVDLTKGLIGLKKDESSFERVILGVFIFELNEDNSQILVHTIDVMIIAERRDDQSVAEKLRVC